MSTSKAVTIRYTSPIDNPHKIPRPHYITVAGGGAQSIRGGECGPVDSLIGFSLNDDGPHDFNRREWVPAELIFDGTFPVEYVIGWFANFGASGNIFTYGEVIESVVVLDLQDAEKSAALDFVVGCKAGA